MTQYLFSYGTLQHEKTQLQLFGRLLKGTKDVLQSYKIESIEITDPAFLAKGEDKYQRTLIKSLISTDAIEGTVLEISEEELLKADTYEPDNYKRIKTTLQSGKEAWIYIAV